MTDTNWTPHDSGDSEDGFPTRGHPPSSGPGCLGMALVLVGVVVLGLGSLVWQLVHVAGDVL